MYAGNGFVSFDDERAICDKTEYAMDNNLNGFIIWEISGDLLRDLSTPLLDATNNRLNIPEIRCAEDYDLEGDVLTAEGQWYPSVAFGLCVNDGKQLENFIRADQMFVSIFIAGDVS